MAKLLRITVIFSILAAFGGSLLPGQATSARIYGTVQNKEGKFLANVEVTAVNVGNNGATKVYSGAIKGSFSFLGLAPGAYQVSFDLPGYRPYVAAGIRLSADQSTTLRITMERLSEAEGGLPEEQAAPEAAAQASPLKTWQVELSTGAFGNESDRLNNVVFGDLDATRNLPRDYYSFYYPSGLAISNWNGQTTGMLKPLGGMQPLTARLRFFLNRWLSLAAGIGWSDRQVDGAYTLSHDFYNGNTAGNHLPAQFSVSSEFPYYRLGVKTLFPHVGAQASQAMGPGFRVAEFVHAGWMLAECRLAFLKKVKDGLLGEFSTEELAMTGQGNSPALEVGFRMDLAIWRGLGAFIEGSYLMSRVTRVTGESASSATVQDLKTLEVLSSVTEKREGRWWNGDHFLARPSVWPAGGPTAGTPFTLDLDGPGVRAGLCFRF